MTEQATPPRVVEELPDQKQEPISTVNIEVRKVSKEVTPELTNLQQSRGISRSRSCGVDINRTSHRTLRRTKTKLFSKPAVFQRKLWHRSFKRTPNKKELKESEVNDDKV